MHDAKAFGWKVGDPEHDWEAMVDTVQNHVKMLNFRYRVGLKSAQVWWLGRWSFVALVVRCCVVVV